LKTVIVVNPTSGRGRAMRLLPQLKAELLRWPTLVGSEIHFTEHRGHAIELAGAAIEAGVEAVVAAGGDGTFHEVLQAVAGTKTRIGLIPFGTGNDLSRELGIGTNWRLAVESIGLGSTRMIDYGTMTGLESGESRSFANIVGCGFDAAVAIEVNRGIRFVSGTAAYLVGVVRCLSRLKPLKLRIETADGTREAEALLCAIANSTSYGGGMKVAPMAKIDDGLFDVVVVKETSLLDFIVTFPRVFKGTHLSHSKIETFRAESLTLESDTPSPMLIDGEIFGQTPVRFKMHPRALEVFAPNGSQ
jgi:diacylglycerol kinase (ATP)